MSTLGKRIMAELLENDLVDVFNFNDQYVMAHIKIDSYKGDYFELLNDLLVKNCSENRNSFLVKKEIYEQAMMLIPEMDVEYAQYA